METTVRARTQSVAPTRVSTKRNDRPSGGPAARSASSAKGQRASRASEASALGSTQSYCFTTPASSTDSVAAAVDAAARRRIRWGARAMLWQASSLKAVRCCGRVLHMRLVILMTVRASLFSVARSTAGWWPACMA